MLIELYLEWKRKWNKLEKKEASLETMLEKKGDILEKILWKNERIKRKNLYIYIYIYMICVVAHFAHGVLLSLISLTTIYCSMN